MVFKIQGPVQHLDPKKDPILTVLIFIVLRRAFCRVPAAVRAVARVPRVAGEEGEAADRRKEAAVAQGEGLPCQGDTQSRNLEIILLSSMAGAIVLIVQSCYSIFRLIFNDLPGGVTVKQ